MAGRPGFTKSLKLLAGGGKGLPGGFILGTFGAGGKGLPGGLALGAALGGGLILGTLGAGGKGLLGGLASGKPLGLLLTAEGSAGQLDAANPPGKGVAARQLPSCLEDIAALDSGLSMSSKQANPGEA